MRWCPRNNRWLRYFSFCDQKPTAGGKLFLEIIGGLQSPYQKGSHVRSSCRTEIMTSYSPWSESRTSKMIILLYHVQYIGTTGRCPGSRGEWPTGQPFISRQIGSHVESKITHVVRIKSYSESRGTIIVQDGDSRTPRSQNGREAGLFMWKRCSTQAVRLLTLQAPQLFRKLRRWLTMFAWWQGVTRAPSLLKRHKSSSWLGNGVWKELSSSTKPTL
jgi:hypothetical protein